MGFGGTEFDMKLIVRRKRIYFDGFLPPSKLDVRLQRLAAQTKNLSAYYQANPITCRASKPNTDDSSWSPNGGTDVRSSVTRLFPPSFLVPAILESLISSPYYRDVTEVVPGEADLYCAKYLKKHGGVVLTGDSDLLVYDLGMDGAVSFFKDVEIRDHDHLQILPCQMYQQAVIMDRLGLPYPRGLYALAFEIFVDHHGTFPKYVAQARSLTAASAKPQIFTDFVKEYTQLPTDVKPGFDASVTFLQVLRRMDPRLSEYVLQVPCLAKLFGLPSIEQSAGSTPHIFLPFLIDSPNRTNAWEISSATRQLAYGLVNLIIPKKEQLGSLFEHRKQQDMSCGRELQLPSIQQLPEACTEVLNIFSDLRDTISISDTLFWTAIATRQEIEWSQTHSKTPLSGLVSQQFARIQAKPEQRQNFTWDIIHFFAQTNGSYYSFRMLKQMLSLVVAHDSNDLVPEPIRLLTHQLDSLPMLKDLPDLGDATALLRMMMGVLNTYDKTPEPASCPQVASAPVKMSRNEAKRRQKRSKDANKVSTGGGRSGNQFSVLTDNLMDLV